MSARWPTALLSVVSLLAASGCSAYSPVEGTVLLDGKPLAGATVTLIPARHAGKAASGVTNQDGVFRVTTDQTEDGAPRGEYRVIITALEPPIDFTPNPLLSLERNKTAWEKAMAQQKKDKTSAGRPAIASRYQDPTRTPLKLRVPPDGRVEFALESGE